jgi:hypothetical protein
MLEEQLELNKGKDVLFRGVVELVLCGEDSDGYDWDGSQEGREELEEIWMRKIQEREDYLYEVASKEVVPITEASEIIVHIAHADKAFVVELTAEEIDLLVKKGGFYLRLTPPKRVEGYDVRIADSFTSVLDNAEEEEMFNVIVILTIDKYNHYSGERYPSVCFKRTYNQELFEPWPISPYEFVNSDAYVPGNGIVIGRDSVSCQVVLPANHANVSRTHCVVTYNPSSGMFVINDRKSSYGTFLANGTKIPYNQPTALRSGDRFYVATPDNMFEVR